MGNGKCEKCGLALVHCSHCGGEITEGCGRCKHCQGPLKVGPYVLELLRLTFPSLLIGCFIAIAGGIFTLVIENEKLEQAETIHRFERGKAASTLLTVIYNADRPVDEVVLVGEFMGWFLPNESVEDKELRSQVISLIEQEKGRRVKSLGDQQKLSPEQASEVARTVRAVQSSSSTNKAFNESVKALGKARVHIIVASFSDKAIAIREAKKLRASGYTDASVYSWRDSFRVTLGKYELQNAYDVLTKAREKNLAGSDAWLSRNITADWDDTKRVWPG